MRQIFFVTFAIVAAGIQQLHGSIVERPSHLSYSNSWQRRPPIYDLAFDYPTSSYDDYYEPRRRLPNRIQSYNTPSLDSQKLELQDQTGAVNYEPNGPLADGKQLFGGGLFSFLRGPRGVDGSPGPQGPTGATGPAGKDGSPGLAGSPGATGPPGRDGVPGKDGTNGAPGKDGPAGPQGMNGKDGAPGKDGIDGKNGLDGAPGKDGLDGAPGKDGLDGAPGKDGLDGAPGKDGLDGAPGKDGLDGAPGKDGLDGAPGKDGLDGAPGKDGLDGAPGKDGLDGATGLPGPSKISKIDLPGDTFSITLKCPADAPNMDIVSAFWFVNTDNNMCGVDATPEIQGSCTGPPAACEITEIIVQGLITPNNPCGVGASGKKLQISYQCIAAVL